MGINITVVKYKGMNRGCVDYESVDVDFDSLRHVGDRKFLSAVSDLGECEYQAGEPWYDDTIISRPTDFGAIRNWIQVNCNDFQQQRFGNLLTILEQDEELYLEAS